MKGLSPLIAAVMLIAVTVSIAMLVMGWFTDLTESTTDTVSNRTTESVSCSSSRISIKDVYVTAGSELNGSARVVVENSGFNDLLLKSLQIYNKTGNNFSTGFATVSIASGEIRTISVANVSVGSCPNDFSKVIVGTNCGGISATYDGAPKCV